VVVLCDPEHQKLKLSVKRTLPSPWSRLREALPPGTRIEGPIRSITDFGLFVSIAEGIDGLVHRSDVSWERDDSPLTDRFRRGQKVEVMVLDIDDERERASLGMKQLQPRPSPDAEPAAAKAEEAAAPAEAPEAAQRAAQAAPADPAPAAANPAQAPAADAPPATDPAPEG
jgi:ribosomal protein S1